MVQSGRQHASLCVSSVRYSERLQDGGKGSLWCPRRGAKGLNLELHISKAYKLSPPRLLLTFPVVLVLKHNFSFKIFQYYFPK